MKNFAVVQNIPSPYRLHMFAAMERLLCAKGWGFHVHFMAEGHSERPDSWRRPQISFPHTYWPDYGRGAHHFNPGLLRHLMKNPPDVLVAGSTFDTFTSILAVHLVKAKVKCAWSEGNTKTTGQMHGLKGWIKREVFSRCGFVGVPGADAMRYIALHQSLTRRKMPECVFLPNIVDETKFRPRNEWPQEEIAAMRKELGAAEGERICFIPARLSPVKGLVPMIELLEKPWLKGWRIVILGQGALHDEIVETAKKRGLDAKIAILPYMPYARMPLVFAASDLLMLPSVYDPNPLSVVEALWSGLPVALSDMAGNVEEGVTEGGNGWVLPVGDKEAFKGRLEEVFAAKPEELRRMGRVSREKNAQFWNTEKTMTAFVERLVGSCGNV